MIDVGCCQAYLRGGERVGRGENRSRTTCPNSNHEQKNHHRHTSSSPDEYEFDSRIRSSTGEMLDARTSSCSGLTWHSIDPALHAVRIYAMPRHLLGCLKAFFCWVEGRCCLAPAWSGVKWLDNEDDKRQEHVQRRKKKVTHRKRAYGKDGVKRCQLWRSMQRFWQLLQPGAFFLWKQCTLN